MWSTAIKNLSNTCTMKDSNILPLPSAVYQEGGYSHSRWHRSLTGTGSMGCRTCDRSHRNKMWNVGKSQNTWKYQESNDTSAGSNLYQKNRPILLLFSWGLPQGPGPIWTHWIASKVPENIGATISCSFECASVVDTCWHHYLSVESV